MQTRSERHSQGQILVSAALLLTVLVSFMGLAVDVGYMVDYRRRMTAAADGAAVAAAWELKRNGVNSRYILAAQQAAADNGFQQGTNGVTITVNRPPLSGDYVGKKYYVEVLIKQPRPTFFLRVLNIKSATVGARAVAGSDGGLGWFYVLDPKAGRGLTLSGSATLNAPLCGIFVNSPSSSAVNTSGSACIQQAQSINITGNISGTACAHPTPKTSVPPVVDPFATLQPPTISGCTYSQKVSVSGATRTLSPGTYCGGIVISGGAKVTFNPGLYIIKSGGLTISASAASGTGVTFIISGGAVTISGGTSVVQLSAPTSGAWEGIL